jgi:hypothetical protein
LLKKRGKELAPDDLEVAQNVPQGDMVIMSLAG